MKPIIIMGPTASGKTELALALAQQLKREIISVDSRQVYQALTVGTAKPAGRWVQGNYLVEQIPYHLVDFLPPDKTFDAAAFCKATQTILANRNQQSFIFAGGTGLYIQAFFVGLDPLPPSDPALRAELTAWTAAHGKEALHQRLQEKDPLSAQQIPAGNIQRVMRALEITLLTGKPASALRTGKFHQPFPTDKAFLVLINWEKDLLHDRIAARTQAMLEPMAEETRALLQKGFSENIPALKSLGYPQIIDWIQGRMTRRETLEKIITLTRQYAKRQRTWFNRYQNAVQVNLTDKTQWNAQQLAQHLIKQYEQSLP